MQFLVSSSPLPGNDILPHINLSPQNWDIVLTCFEPLAEVTGGIGTYHRLLIQELCKNGLNILILTRNENKNKIALSGVTTIYVDELKPRKAFNFVGLQHEFFSLHCHFALRDLYENGHRFSFIEFSDYGGDGFYPLRARASGIYNFDCAAVRLHSPNMMLVEDNGGVHWQLDNFHRDQIDREISVYDDADIILHGGNAMRDRVVSLAHDFGIDITHKMIKCPHPYPRHLFNKKEKEAVDINEERQKLILKIKQINPYTEENIPENAVFIGVFGRIENRKGQFQLFWKLLSDSKFVEYVKNNNIHFLICGHNVLDHLGQYKLNDLYSLIHQQNVQGRFHFTGRVSQDELAKLSMGVSGYIFPSIFENYPNALLEVLPTCKPIALSVHGCMPEITDSFQNITHIDPKNLATGSIISFLQEVVDLSYDTTQEELEYRVEKLEARNEIMKDFYRQKFDKKVPLRVDSRPSIGFVIPVYQEYRYLKETLKSIVPILEAGDEVVVVDDGSDLRNAKYIEKITDATDVKLVVLEKNSGPAIARLRGVQAVNTDLVQFCDADDLINSESIKYIRRLFIHDPNLTMATGIMSCFQDADHCWVPRNGQIWTALTQNFAHSGSMFRRKPLLNALSVKHDRLPMNEDWLMNLLILAHGGKCRMIPEITYYYRRFPGTRSTQNILEEGNVREKIIGIFCDEIKFKNPELNSRLKFMIKELHNSNHGSGSKSLPGVSMPLRYQVVDSLYEKLSKRKFTMRFMSWIKPRILSIYRR